MLAISSVQACQNWHTRVLIALPTTFPLTIGAKTVYKQVLTEVLAASANTVIMILVGSMVVRASQDANAKWALDESKLQHEHSTISDGSFRQRLKTREGLGKQVARLSSLSRPEAALDAARGAAASLAEAWAGLVAHQTFGFCWFAGFRLLLLSCSAHQQVHLFCQRRNWLNPW